MIFWRRPRFRQVASEVLESKLSVYAPTTKQLAQFHINRLVECFGDQRVHRISDVHWAKYVNAENQKNPRTFFDDRKFMRIILFHAQSRNLLISVPRLPIPDLPSDAGRELTFDELARLEAAASPTLRFQIRIAWKMGLRLREMLGLRWDQIDWRERCIILRARKTKSRRKRQVPIPDDLMPEFRARFAQKTSKWLFPSPKGHGPCHENKTAWKRCKAKAGVRARWHDLRHTCATLMRRRGIADHLIQSILGMSQQTLKRYTHLDKKDVRRVALAMKDRKKSVRKAKPKRRRAVVSSSPSSTSLAAPPPAGKEKMAC